MADGNKRFIEGALETGSGITRALLQKSLMDYERQKAEEDAAIKKEAFGLSNLLTGAQTDLATAKAEELREPEPEKAITMEDLKVQALSALMGSDPDQATRIMFPEAFKDKAAKTFGGDPEGVYRQTAGGAEQIVAPFRKPTPDKSIIEPIDYMNMLIGLEGQVRDEDSPFQGLSADSILTSLMGKSGARLPKDVDNEDPELDTAKKVEEYVRQNPGKEWLLKSKEYLDMKGR